MLSRIQSAIFFSSLIATTTALSQTAAKPSSHEDKRLSAPANTYVGTAACSRCHLEIANNFAKASMGHSTTRISPEFLKTLPANLGAPAAYTDPKTGHKFEVHEEDGKLFETESETDAGGNELFHDTRELEWLVGGGENGYAGIVRRDGYLFQAPLTYYSKPARWDFAPGYDLENLSFRRVVIPACASCHTGRPQPVAGATGKYEAQPFTQTSVGCENCHGPGSAHVEARRQGEEPGSGSESRAKSQSRSHPESHSDPTIVNPARLSPQRSDDICMSCHQAGDVRVLQPGKTNQDFRPGQPLDRTVSIFQIPPTRENPPQDDHLEHYYSMSLSKCFRASAKLPEEKQLRCITCHDPHVEPAKEEAPAYFNGKCLGCHTAQSCTAPLAVRQKTTPQNPVKDNCIGCHMPQRDIRIISHSSATNHRIVTRPDEPFPDETFAQTTAAMPDLLHLNPAGARGAKAALPPALIRLQAYAGLMPGKPDYEASWRKTLAELEASNPENAIVQAALGKRDLADEKFAQAIAHFERSLRLDPAQPEVYMQLAQAQEKIAQSGQNEQAIANTRKAVELAPFVPGFQRALIFRLVNAKRYGEAEAAAEKYLQIFPGDDSLRKMLAAAKEQ
jgi:Flp pilus assembly protein TadD